MFLNISNHPSTRWSEAQVSAAKEMTSDGKIVDIAFPNIDPHATMSEVRKMALDMVDKVLALGNVDAVLCQGEMSFVYNFVSEMEFDSDIPVVAATTERKTVEVQNPDGSTTKSSTFEFVQFRPYF